MKRYITFALFLLPVLLFAQETQNQQASQAGSTENIEVRRPVQAANTPMFTMKHESFNHKLDLKGRGELLQVEFQLYNDTDVDLKLYIFAIATEEELDWNYNSFGTKKMNLHDSNILYFKAEPADEELYTYELENGEKQLVKYPKDVTAGVNPATGEPYLLKDTMAYRADMLSHYRKKFSFFNHVTILIFDADTNELVFRQIWTLDGRRK